MAEYKNVSKGTGDIYSLLTNEVKVNSRHLLGLHHDPYMFHQANLRYSGADDFFIGSAQDSETMSLFQVWTTVIVNELIRLVTWPVISLKHDDVSSRSGFPEDQANINQVLCILQGQNGARQVPLQYLLEIQP